MIKRPQKHGGISMPIHPIVTEGPLPRDPLNVRIMRREIHRLETNLKQQNGEVGAFRRLLISKSLDEHWEVPG